MENTTPRLHSNPKTGSSHNMCLHILLASKVTCCISLVCVCYFSQIAFLYIFMYTGYAVFPDFFFSLLPQLHGACLQTQTFF